MHDVKFYTTALLGLACSGAVIAPAQAQMETHSEFTAEQTVELTYMANSEACLTYDKAAGANPEISVQDCSEEKAQFQQWTPFAASEGQYILQQSHQDGYVCLAVEPELGSNGVARASTAPCNSDSSAQMWTLNPIGNGYGALQSFTYGETYCLEGNGPGGMMNASSIVMGCRMVTGQQWNARHAATAQPQAEPKATKWDQATFVKLEGHESHIWSVAFSPDGTQIVTGADDGTAKVWGSATFKEVGMLTGHYDAVKSASFSPDGTQIITGSIDYVAQIWDSRTFQKIKSLNGHSNAVMSAAFSPNGKQIVTASHDQTIKVWNSATFKEVGTMDLGSSVRSASFSQDSKWIVTVAKDNTAKIWDSQTFEEVGTLRGHTGFINSVAFSPDGTQIITGSEDNTARIWDSATFEEVKVLEGHVAVVTSASFSPDGTQILTASGDFTAKVWDIQTSQDIGTLEGHTGGVLSASFSPDGLQIVTASVDQTARIWSAND